ncbi:hypothetical protein PC118_g9241 [Phytophthora cactorum]|uniref:Uncharacterized protein n=1 Tax=Phytophthora cactorum TaxID=29920 RepID=A0A8T1FW04_9STRA|nr:hypothetical protein PC112_g9771 [Phytophthora cactorum]KAG2907329.1 hypothetical protein PC114_g10834 [Phytophthora cactorum]KAG2922198.1 hypothetical protein PC115_g9323 [Phytophthora cactorum]KAG2983764.1 hypothetical protein PC118_g9241 [Phytophthora cactorum]KAG3168351.1 hypothetical protein C6341_g11331 [Phytophthora cactorum]
MAEVHMAIADSHHLWAEVDRLKSQVHELRAISRLAQEERARTAELLASFVTRAQLDAALSTKVSLAHVDAQMDTMRSEVAAHLAQKADLASLVTLQSTKLDVSVFDANAWDLHKLRVAMEQHVRDLFATFAGQVENQVNTKLGIEDFNRVFNPEATGQKASLETAALRISKMTDQLESLSSYMNGDRQRQRQVAELNVNMLDLARKQTAARNSIVQLESAEQATTDQLRAFDKQTTQAVAKLQSLTEALRGLQAQTQADKSVQDARQVQLAHNVKQLEAHNEYIRKTLSELEQFARAGLTDAMDAKLKVSNEKLQNELSKASATSGQHYQQLNQRMNQTKDLLLYHKERLAQVDACIRKLAGLLKETQGDLNNVKGPLATLATNLHEENVSILQEIERSQNGARDIMLDYQDLLEREKSSQVFASLPSRPSSSSSTTGSSDATSASRKHKQQMSLATKAANRPHTSSARVHECSTLNGALPLGVRRSADRRRCPDYHNDVIGIDDSSEDEEKADWPSVRSAKREYQRSPRCEDASGSAAMPSLATIASLSTTTQGGAAEAPTNETPPINRSLCEPFQRAATEREERVSPPPPRPQKDLPLPTRLNYIMHKVTVHRSSAPIKTAADPPRMPPDVKAMICSSLVSAYAGVARPSISSPSVAAPAKVFAAAARPARVAYLHDFFNPKSIKFQFVHHFEDCGCDYPCQIESCRMLE